MSWRVSRLLLESLEPRRMLHGDDSAHEGGTTIDAEAAPEFLLTDVNPTSSTYQQLVSPRDFVGQVSGWYFGQAS